MIIKNITKKWQNNTKDKSMFSWEGYTSVPGFRRRRAASLAWWAANKTSAARPETSLSPTTTVWATTAINPSMWAPRSLECKTSFSFICTDCYWFRFKMLLGIKQLPETIMWIKLQTSRHEIEVAIILHSDSTTLQTKTSNCLTAHDTDPCWFTIYLTTTQGLNSYF